jgi:hypothetical protein
MRIPAQSAALIVGPIEDQVAAVIATHFVATYRWSADALGEGSHPAERPEHPIGVIIVTEPWPSLLTAGRVTSLRKLCSMLQAEGSLLLLTDSTLDEASAGTVDSGTGLRSAGFSRVNRYVVEPLHHNPHRMIPLTPAALRHADVASRGVIDRLRKLRDLLERKSAPRLAGFIAYR